MTLLETSSAIRSLPRSSTTAFHGPVAAAAVAQPSLEDQMRPESIPADAWHAIWQNLSQQIGSDYANYSIKLAADANYLYTVGQTISDVSTLWGFEIAQADASLNPVQSLAGSVDASLPTPGLPLSFSRVYRRIDRLLATSSARSAAAGPTTGTSSAETEPNGDVVLRGPGGVDRFFTLQTDGTYKPSPGDFGVVDPERPARFASPRPTRRLAVPHRRPARLRPGHERQPDHARLHGNGLLTSLTHSNGQQLLIDYNAQGRIAHVTNPLGPGPADDLVTTYAYDASGEHLVQVTQPGNRVTTYTYDTGNGAPTRACPALGRLSRRHARLLRLRRPGPADLDLGRPGRPDSSPTPTTRPAASRSPTPPAARPSSATASTARSPRCATATAASSTSATTPQSLLTQLVGPSGEKYGYSYDTHGNLTGVRDPLRQTTTFTYDPTFNQLTSVTDARGNGMQYAYDTHGNLTSITYADGTQENYTYDAHGNVLTATNRRGQTLTYTYNAAGAGHDQGRPDTPGIDFIYTYDTAGNLMSAHGRERHDDDDLRPATRTC